MAMKKITSAVFLLLATSLHAQQLTVKSVKLLSNDSTAITQPCLTANDDTCALIKIKGDGVAGLEFTDPSQYIEKRYDTATSTYLVYVYRTPRLSFKHREYLPGQIDMSLSGFRKPKDGKTYLVQLEAPEMNLSQSVAILKVEPANAILTFNGQTIPIAADGIFELPVDEGSYSYEVRAENFLPQNGTLTISKGESKTLPIQLQPILHPVTVACNVSKAHVVVDNKEYGPVGNLLFQQGTRHLRVYANGYLDVEREVVIDEGTKRLDFKLEKSNIRTIKAVPITIQSKAAKLFVNNKRVPEWHDGSTIKLRPGKYMLSDEDGNEKLITVKKETPMTIEL